jgi:hypothetical protein
MGNQVKKKRYISEMHDNCQNLDQYAQSFAGRCCGYKKHDINIYCNVELINEYIDIRNTDYVQPPGRCRHIISKDVSNRTYHIRRGKDVITSTNHCNKLRKKIIKLLKQKFKEEMSGCTIGNDFKPLRKNYIPCDIDGNEVDEVVEGETYYKYRLIQTASTTCLEEKIWTLKEFIDDCLPKVPVVKPSSNPHGHHLIHRYPVSIDGKPRWIIVFWNGMKKEGIVDNGKNSKKAFNAV